MTLDTRQAAVSAASLPRHNLDAETAVLGAMLLNPDAIGVALDVVAAEDFYRPNHAAIFSAIISLFNRNLPADVLTVQEEIRRLDPRTPVTVADLTHLSLDTPGASNVESYAAIVADTAQLRRLDIAAVKVREIARDAVDAPAAVDAAEHVILSVSNDIRRLPAANGFELASSWITQAEEAAANPGLRGLSTGYTDLDAYLRGMRPGQFIVVAARPSVGKTAFGLNLALAVARSGVGVLFCSLEMGREEIAMRLGSMISGVDHELVLSGTMSAANWDALQRGAEELARLPIWVDDDATLDVTRIKARARRRLRDGLGLIIVDYLQLVATPDAETRQVAVSALSRGAKIMAKQLAVPVIALSQMNRDVEKRLSKTPVLADIRESGSLEQDADTVLLLSRDLDAGSPKRGVLEVIVAKNRSGRTGRCELAWRAHLTSLVSLAKTPPFE